MVNDTKLYTASKVVTMNPSKPEAEAVAVRDGKILEVGSTEELRRMNPDEVDDQFSEKVLFPGFVEAHSHSHVGHVWDYPYIGYFDRTSPSGRSWSGCKKIKDVIEVLRSEERKLKKDEPLIAWGVESIYFNDDIDASILDKISDKRPILVLHCNGHVASVNSALINQAGIAEKSDVEGIVTDKEGNPTGILQESKAMKLAGDPFLQIRPNRISEEAIKNYGRIARNNGITTLGEVGGPNLRESTVVDQWEKVVNDPEYPARVSFAYSPLLGGKDENISHPETAQYLKSLSQESTGKLRFGNVKFFTDGSIQGFTARLNWPGYHTSDDDGIWITPPEELEEKLEPYHNEGLTIFCHCNGDEASKMFIDTIETLQNKKYRPDHRHSIQHCQMATRSQYRRMNKIGICANIFSNHLYYYGDTHESKSIGPERARRMDACATAAKEGVPFTLHADAPVTPMSQLHTAWCAVNRQTATGQNLGEFEQISIEEALEAVTLGAAYQLNMDNEIGSIEAGKRADFAVLDRDPRVVDSMELKNIDVWGTVVGGIPHQSPS